MCHPLFRRTVGLVALVSLAAVARGGTIDHFGEYNAIVYDSDLNGVAQTFTAADPFLADASVRLAHPASSSQATWWTDGHFELRHGEPGRWDGTSGNVLFRSPRIDFAALPQAGVDWSGNPLYELRLANVGFAQPVATDVGDVYSLVLVDGGTAGYLNYAAHQATQQNPGYPGGGFAWHGRHSGDLHFQTATFPPLDLAFKVVGVPDPAAGSVAVLLALAATRRRRATAAVVRSSSQA